MEPLVYIYSGTPAPDPPILFVTTIPLIYPTEDVIPPPPPDQLGPTTVELLN
jgi:hypothetical protein